MNGLAVIDRNTRIVKHAHARGRSILQDALITSTVAPKESSNKLEHKKVKMCTGPDNGTGHLDKKQGRNNAGPCLQKHKKPWEGAVTPIFIVQRTLSQIRPALTPCAEDTKSKSNSESKLQIQTHHSNSKIKSNSIQIQPPNCKIKLQKSNSNSRVKLDIQNSKF